MPSPHPSIKYGEIPLEIRYGWAYVYNMPKCKFCGWNAGSEYGLKMHVCDKKLDEILRMYYKKKKIDKIAKTVNTTKAAIKRALVSERNAEIIADGIMNYTNTTLSKLDPELRRKVIKILNTKFEVDGDA